MNASTTHRCLIETLETRKLMSASGPSIIDMPMPETVATVVPIGHSSPRIDVSNYVVDARDTVETTVPSGRISTRTDLSNNVVDLPDTAQG